MDKPLLKDLLTFKKSFLSDQEIFTISNEGSIEGFTLVKSDFKKIQITETETPSPEAVIVSGRIEELKFSIPPTNPILQKK
ncbi:MAG: hypothetical protein ACJLTB_17045 [Algoriphagus aquaeductus]|uniref:hypothetical protein n=1 Tax=Algoriphagus aquaeductus TaxID=475299 RepID=UPI0038797E96